MPPFRARLRFAMAWYMPCTVSSTKGMFTIRRVADVCFAHMYLHYERNIKKYKQGYNGAEVSDGPEGGVE